MMARLTDLFRRTRNRWIPIYSSPQKYWAARYARLGASLIGPGCLCLDDAGNRKDYDEKWRHIRSSVSGAGDPQRQTLLDAGCGIGVLTARFMSLGFDVTAVDFAPNAVDIARSRIGESVRWYTGALHHFHADQTYDLVACVDVLFHVTDDTLFEATVAHLAALVRQSGRLVIQEELVEQADVLREGAASASHVRWRTLAWYRSILGPAWHLRRHDHYQLPVEGQEKDLLVFCRK